ncbi:MAG: hypothetical protein LAO22_01970 [Acidobacteriia bacterium]|nr:hypothetical protein [Terriglobia bacterium]
MTASFLFLVGLGLTLVTAFAIVAYMRSPLHSILVELCGTRERAAFWVSFSNVTITLVPLIFAMHYTPDLKAGNAAVLELATQLKWALAGLLFAVLILGWVLSSFMRRQSGQFATKQAPAAAL